MLDARDADDDAHADRSGDLFTEICRVADRFDQAPELVGTFPRCWSRTSRPTLRCDRLLKRYRNAVEIVADIIRRGQRAGRYRADLDAAAKAVEILAFVNGMETSWLLDPSIPLAEVCKGYAATLARDFAPPAGTSEATRGAVERAT